MISHRLPPVTFLPSNRANTRRIICNEWSCETLHGRHNNNREHLLRHNNNREHLLALPLADTLIGRSDTAAGAHAVEDPCGCYII